MDHSIPIYGTAETPTAAQRVELGPLSFLETPEALRQIRWHGIELVRAVTWPIRDLDWGTYPQEGFSRQAEQSDQTYQSILRFTVFEGRLTCEIEVSADSSGTLDVRMTMTPTGGPFQTNRAGLTVLHPIKGIAGAPLKIRHSDGVTEATAFPQLISPGQPVFDIVGLAYGTEGCAVDIGFSGEIFEMEDQRNWSDASFKTYCVPLIHPFVYPIKDRTIQKVQIRLGGAPGAAATLGEAGARFERLNERAPAIGLAVEAGWIDQPLIDEARPQYLNARLGPVIDDAYLGALAKVSGGRDLDVEIVLPREDHPLAALIEAKAALDRAGLTPARVTALPQDYLASHQPSGPWPNGPTPAAASAICHSVFPGTLIGGGMLTNFTEMNRCRPDPSTVDFITHGSSAIVHAGDDLSVCETLEALPQIFESGRSIAAATAYRLGLISIGMRSNPYGDAVAENPQMVRRTMAHADPRQHAMFAAAWAVGVLSATEGHGIEAISMAAPTGPLGLAHLSGAGVVPLFHIVREAAAMAGCERVRISGLPTDVYGIAARDGGGVRAMIANASPDPKTIRLRQKIGAVLLDTSSFEAACSDTAWLQKAAATQTHEIILEGFATAFLTA